MCFQVPRVKQGFTLVINTDTCNPTSELSISATWDCEVPSHPICPFPEPPAFKKFLWDLNWYLRVFGPLIHFLLNPCGLSVTITALESLKINYTEVNKVSSIRWIQSIHGRNVYFWIYGSWDPEVPRGWGGQRKALHGDSVLIIWELVYSVHFNPRLNHQPQHNVNPCVIDL